MHCREFWMMNTHHGLQDSVSPDSFHKENAQQLVVGNSGERDTIQPKIKVLCFHLLP